MIPENLSRRAVLKLAILGGALLPFTARALEMSEDGLFTQSWFLDSFLILNEDMADAQAEGKNFVIFWELRGCPFCKAMHERTLSQPHVKNFVSENFSVLQLNLIGSRLVTDFDGEELPEKDLARKHGVKFTPTLQFFSPNSNEPQVHLTHGFHEPAPFLSHFNYVAGQYYQSLSYDDFVKESNS